MKWFTGIIIALFCTVLNAQIDVKAPEQSPLSSLVYITLSDGGFDTVDLEIWAGEQEVKFEEIVSASPGSKTYVFTGPAGSYTVRAFGWSAGKKPEKYRGKIIIGGDSPPTPPGPPAPDVLEGLAGISRAQALKVFSVARGEEAAKIAEVYLGAAARAAALPGFTAKDMTNAVREGLADFGESEKKSWGQWAEAVAAELNKLPPDREKYIEAYQQIAKGLEGVK
jgi:hypothetical protein